MAILQEGQVIRETYEVERLLGEGAFAEVYRVKHCFLGRQAMKVFKRGGMTQREIEKILGEAILLSRIGHPNIVRVFDANIFESDGGLRGYFTMENVPGGSLEKFWHSHGTQFIPTATVVDIIKQVCRGIQIAHRSSPPIIHRDIKPQNILVGYEADGLRARVSDFGLAKEVNPLTLLATAAGTLSFKPPEAFSDSKGDSCAADVWAIGVTLYLLLTDRLPIEINPTLGWNEAKAFETKFLPPSSYNAEVNDSLDRIIYRCLERKSSDRYPSATELLDALEDWKPTPVSVEKKMEDPGSHLSKTVLGRQTSANQEEGEQAAKNALKIAKSPGRLMEAADTMEEAFNKWPTLRARYATQVKLWRCGVSM